MNEAPNNQSGLGETFSSQPATQTNPFTADLKGEFTSNFGTDANAVSQIFKEGGFVNNNRTKYLIIGGVVIAVLAILFFVMSGEDSSTDGEELAEEDSAGEEATGEEKDEAATEEAATEETAEETTAAATDATAATDAATSAAPTSAPATASKAISGGPISLTEPVDGSSLNYDETQGPAVFSWSGGGGYIVFSRNSSMNPTVFRIPVSGNTYSFHNPWPGNWFWKVENSSGASEVRSFKVAGPSRRNVALTQPASGGTVAGNGGTVSWQGDGNVAYYRVELSTGGWAAPQHRFATSGNSVTLNGVTAGSYQMRVGAFSEVSGRWEYTAPVGVTVQ